MHNCRQSGFARSFVDKELQKKQPVWPILSQIGLNRSSSTLNRLRISIAERRTAAFHTPTFHLFSTPVAVCFGDFNRNKADLCGLSRKNRIAKVVMRRLHLFLWRAFSLQHSRFGLKKECNDLLPRR